MNEVITILISTVMILLYLVGFLCLVALTVSTASKAWHKHAGKEIKVNIDWNIKNEKNTATKS